MDAMYEIVGFVTDKEDPFCEKVTDCLLVRCTLGTYEGPMCAKCLVRHVKIRASGAKKAPPQPQPNGEHVVHEFPG